MTQHGGPRPGAGRPKKLLPESEFFEDAESYLQAVVQGRIVADPLRVQAAKSLLPFQQRKRRSPMPSARAPHKQAVADERAASAEVNEKFKIRLAEIKKSKEKEVSDGD